MPKSEYPDGVYTADPRKVPKARKLKEITYDEMLDLATLGGPRVSRPRPLIQVTYAWGHVFRSFLNERSELDGGDPAIVEFSSPLG